MAKYKRRIKLIQPSLQLKLIGTFMGVSALAMLLQFMLFTSSMTEVAAELPEDGALLLEALQAATWKILLLTFGMLLPVTALVGVVATFRWAGPIFRFKQHLSRIALGERPGPCKIRKGDELQDFCEVLNQAVNNLQGLDQQSSPKPTTADPIRRVA